MSKTTLNLRFNGTSNQVEVYNDGQLVLHKSTDKTGARTHLLSSSGGTHTLNTLHELKIEVVSGPVEIAVAKGETKSFNGKGKLTLQPGVAFTVKSAGPVLLRCTPKPGPGLGDEGNEPTIVD